MGFAKLTTLFLLVNGFIFVQTQSNRIKWESASTVPTNQLLPAGKEDDFTYYVGRGYVGNNWLNGKSLFIRGKHIAYIPHQGQEFRRTDFQVLVAPPGTISWVVAQGDSLPQYWIVGGIEPDSEERTFICRAFHGSHLIVGKGLQSVGACFVGIRYRVYEYASYEVLVLNAYGIATGAAKVGKIPGHILVGPHRQRIKQTPMQFNMTNAVRI